MRANRRLDLSLLEQALSQLKAAIFEHGQHPEKDVYRDSVVMRFVFTYELTVQAAQRYVQAEHLKPLPDDELTTPRVIRRATALGILKGEWENFAVFRDARNAVAHTYSVAKAQEVVHLAAELAEQAQFLLDQIRAKRDE